ncbi:aminotransferase class I/II-fold pyridoxal phosphate-dependent enzyme [Xylophilus rhododendri]|uniref:Aminotransferase class I/II-fold pyridoxal phosphate-dependent enzyme n=1 Tax=Xylophilus rhododendri TaxID=2697032 RepID=A0A857J579_9BURK|nr:PLP-dependent aminotransferase family protein [Xylophilus rhododendri]QHI98363.1 aminotransferase class I/II-fold pyridoxal phosphate-dependent enzyme [Xylophilus rhododendri]
MTWTLAARTRKMTSSAIRDLLKLTERPGIISFAGGLPSPAAFPVEAFAAACDKVLTAADARSSLQYATTEGLPALREAVAASLPWKVDPANVLITTGSQQGLDLAAKVLIDPGSRILVETPTYLGALQAFQPMEPTVVGVASDESGALPDDLKAKAEGARFFYALPNFQNPTGRTMDEARRVAVSEAARQSGVPILEDNPYGELWFDAPPPAPLTSRDPENTIYMGSFSKVLAPGLRLGFLVAPTEIHHRLVMAKQAADLHSPSFNQRVVAEVLKDGFLDRHVPTIRALYKGQRDAMLAALDRDMSGLGVSWNRPAGGMFLWVRLPAGLSAAALLPRAVEKGVAFVPGEPFYAGQPDDRTLRLSFVTASREQIATGVAALAAAVREAIAELPAAQRDAALAVA